MVESNPEIKTEKRTILQKFLAVEKKEFPVQNPFIYKSACNNKFKLHTVEYPQEGELKGIIFLILGYGEFSDLYGKYFEEFAKAGLRVFSYDRKGFGKSEGARGRVGKHLEEECLGFIDLVIKERGYQDVKKFLYGVSMGGLLSTRIAIDRPSFFDGILLNVPWFDSRIKITGFKKVIFSVVCLAIGNVSIAPKGLKPEQMEALDYLRKNLPYRGPDIQPNTIKKAMPIQRFVKQQCEKIQTPILMVLGENDLVVCNTTAKAVFEKLPKHEMSKLVVIPEASHGMHFQDGEWQTLHKNNLDWILEIVSKGKENVI